MDNQSEIKLYILDDHELVRDGIKALLANEKYIEVVGDQKNDENIIHKLKESHSDILILDMFLPDLEGIRIAKEVSTELPNISILILSGSTDEEIILGALQSGAMGYIQKDITKAELLHAIYEVTAGNIYIGTDIKNKLSSDFITRAKFGDKYSKSKLLSLTAREIEIIKYLAQGLISKEIANIVNVSPRTVESHKRNIMEKLNLNCIVDIVKFAIKNKIIDL